jgi:NarL family two-component system response regulator LiaR
LIKIVIIDDHQMIVDGLKSVLMADPALRVIGSAPSLSRGLSLIQEHDPDVIILDIRLTDVSGISVVERTRRVSSRAIIIVLTGFGVSLREESLRAGADVFLSKETASDVIVRTIRQSVAVHDPTWTSREALSPREREIAALAAGGKSNPEIASLLGVSINTVKTHLSHVMAKMGVAGRVALALEWKKRYDAHEPHLVG